MSILKRCLRNEKGFTMIEMMVVLIIIAVLIGAGVKFYIGYVDKAKITKAKGDITTMQAALDSYYAENNAYPAGGDLSKAGLSTDIISTDGAKVYKYQVSNDNSSYVVSTSKTVDGTNYVYGKGENGKSEAPTTDKTVPSPGL
ncbi:type IV pilin protein [Desulfofundulus thermocisternus]|uniref:type IV pilin protein n=1 Tax=Desulfofundulus thermocisternus TaxID=42471 RepID=UPI00217E9DBC|nr:prepilin-type N-terminal cleavage/methylation domain-containing protein [Desulfofundulus thermocisternus]MCS5694822.1 prepilin-type N-terminal cleavage/methylation domain-containing protein [Desulfofundulus thermocisternus]